MNAELTAADIDRLDPTCPFEGDVDTYVEPPAPVVGNPRELPAEFYAARKRNEAGCGASSLASAPGSATSRRSLLPSAASAYQEKRDEIFERCDTDGFSDRINADLRTLPSGAGTRFTSGFLTSAPARASPLSSLSGPTAQWAFLRPRRGAS